MLRQVVEGRVCTLNMPRVSSPYMVTRAMLNTGVWLATDQPGDVSLYTVCVQGTHSRRALAPIIRRHSSTAGDQGSSRNVSHARGGSLSPRVRGATIICTITGHLPFLDIDRRLIHDLGVCCRCPCPMLTTGANSASANNITGIYDRYVSHVTGHAGVDTHRG